MLDSGTTFIGVPRDYWMHLRPVITKGRNCQYDFASFDGAVKCKGTAASKFPTISFTFGDGDTTATFKLTGKDYVECFDDGWCKPRLTISSISDFEHLFIFGIFFMRKYVTLFDHGTRHMIFAEAVGYDEYLLNE
jgi:hypothetical protein